jgi:hypothetical protein
VSTSSHTSRTILASQSLAAAGSVNGTEVDNTAGYGLLVCGKCTNGGTGPTIACQMNVYTGESTGTKRLYQSLVFDLGNSAVSERVCEIPPEAMFVNVTLTGNTGQAVTVECYGQHLTGI